MATFKPGPIQQPVETPPKGRGKPGPKPRTTTRSTSLKNQIAGMLMTMNLALYIIPPLRLDVMDEVEIEALARALDEQAKQSPRFRQFLETALAAGSGGTLFGVCAIIGARRASRHGMLPTDIDQALGNLLAQGLQAPQKGTADVGAA